MSEDQALSDEDYNLDPPGKYFKYFSEDLFNR